MHEKGPAPDAPRSSTAVSPEGKTAGATSKTTPPLTLGKALKVAYRAWAVGDLARAKQALEPWPAGGPREIEVALLGARVASELGSLDAALEQLERAEVAGCGRPVLQLLRGVFLYDHARAEEAREALQPLAAENPIAHGILALLELSENGAPYPPFALLRPARWMSEVTGRLVPLLEERLRAKGEDEFLHLNRGVFLTKPARPSPIEKAFLDLDLDRVLELGAGTQDLEGNDSRLLALALIVKGKLEEARRKLERALEPSRDSPDLHFLLGLLHTTAGRRRESGWCFARATRLSDLDMDDVVRELSARVGVQVRLLDEVPPPGVPLPGPGD